MLVMTNGNPIGKQFESFGLNLVVDSVESDWGLFSDPRVTIEAHPSSNGENDNPFGIKSVIFNGPATVVFWARRDQDGREVRRGRDER